MGKTKHTRVTYYCFIQLHCVHRYLILSMVTVCYCGYWCLAGVTT